LLDGAPAAFARHQLVALARPGPDDDRLEQPVGGDRVLELLEGGGIEGAAGLVAIGPDLGDGQLPQRALALGFFDRDPQQGLEPAAQAALALRSAQGRASSVGIRVASMLSADVRFTVRVISSSATLRYVCAPIEPMSYSRIGLPKLGASASLTFLGI